MTHEQPPGAWRQDAGDAVASPDQPAALALQHLQDHRGWRVVGRGCAHLSILGHDHSLLDDYQFTHLFYRARGEGGSQEPRLSLEMPLLLPLTRRLGVRRAVRIKANLNLRTERRVRYVFHTDTDQQCSTAVYYLNTNNGVTLFADGGRVESVENRMAIFDSSIRHAGTTCTDQKVRVAINFHYHPAPPETIGSDPELMP